MARLSITKRLAALAATAVVVGTAGPAGGEIVIDRNTTIDSTIRNEEVHVVEGTNPNPPTVVEIVEPAHLDRKVEVFDSSVVNMQGGWITDHLHARDSSVVNVWGGRVGVEEHLWAWDSSTVNVFGGEIWDDLTARGSSTVNISGGRILEDVAAADSSTVNISGGWILDDLWAFDSSTVNVFDGQVDAAYARDASRVSISGGLVKSLRAGQAWDEMTTDEHTSIITIAGSGFNYPFGRIPDSEGTLTGTLANGDPINAGFEIYSEASIVLVPEPSTFILLSIGAASLAFYVWRRRCHGKAAGELP